MNTPNDDLPRLRIVERVVQTTCTGEERVHRAIGDVLLTSSLPKLSQLNTLTSSQSGPAIGVTLKLNLPKQQCVVTSKKRTSNHPRPKSISHLSGSHSIASPKESEYFVDEGARASINPFSYDSKPPVPTGKRDAWQCLKCPPQLTRRFIEDGVRSHLKAK